MWRDVDKRLRKLEEKRICRSITPEESDAWHEAMVGKARRTGRLEIDVYEGHPLLSIDQQIRILDPGIPGVAVTIHRHMAGRME